MWSYSHLNAQTSFPNCSISGSSSTFTEPTALYVSSGKVSLSDGSVASGSDAAAGSVVSVTASPEASVVSAPLSLVIPITLSFGSSEDVFPISSLSLALFVSSSSSLHTEEIFDFSFLS